MEERELINRSLKGDERAFGMLVDAYADMVAATIFSILGKHPEAEDIGQEVFVSLFRNLHRFREDATLKTYLQKIAINACRSEMRKQRLAKWKFWKDANSRDLETANAVAETHGHSNELRDALMRSLPSHMREVMSIHLIQGFSTRETAHILGVAEGTVLSRVARARSKMKETLKQLNNANSI